MKKMHTLIHTLGVAIMFCGVALIGICISVIHTALTEQGCLGFVLLPIAALYIPYYIIKLGWALYRYKYTEPEDQFSEHQMD